MFEFGPEARALSGVEYSLSADLSYRLSSNQDHITEASFYLYGRTYTLSSASQATVPDISGSDFAYAVAEASLSHRHYLFDGLGPTGVELNIGHIWSGGHPLWQYYEVSLSQGFNIGTNGSATILASVENRVAQDEVQSDTVVYKLQGFYAHRFGNQDNLRLMLGYQFNDAIDPTYTYSDISASVSYALSQPVWGMNLSFNVGGGYKNYDEFILSLDGRRDTYGTVGATADFYNISYYGFSPRVSLSATKTNSNVVRYSTLELQGSIGIQSNF